MSPELKAVYEDELERMDGLLIAAEQWASSYKSDRDSYKRVVKNEAKLRRQIRGVFRDMSKSVDRYINWSSYYQQQALMQASAKLDAAVDVEVIVSDQYYDDLDGLFFSVTFETIAYGTAIGAQAAEVVYKVPIGIRSTDALIQDLTTKRLAYLVGKKVDKDGNIVDNPKADYRISDVTRQDIAKNIKTGMALGEDKATMTARLQTVVNNPARAERIAQTETVNAYGQGTLAYGQESKATGKEWEDVNAHDVCADNASEGVIPLNAMFISGNMCPAAHTGCRCNMRLVYANEFPG